jgi:hypothetical protein
MLDLIYILGTLAFFALMLAYVRACAALGGVESRNGERSAADRP